MAAKHRRHEKIRFGRDDHVPLHRLPSGLPVASVHALHGWARVVHAFARIFIWVAAALIATALATAIYLYVVGVQNSRFTGMVQTAIQKVAGPQLVAELADARLSLDNSAELAFEADGIVFKDGSGAPVATIDGMLLGVNVFSLLGGEVEIRKIDVNGLHLAGGGKGFSLPAAVTDAGGRVRPGQVPGFLDAAFLRVFAELDRRNLEEVSITDAVLGAGPAAGSIKNLSMARSKEGGYNVESDAQIGTQAIAVEGILTANSYVLQLDGFRFGEQIAYDASQNEGDAVQLVPLHGEYNLNVTGSTIDGKRRVRVRADVPNFDFQNSRKVRIAGQATFDSEILEGQDKVELLPSRIDIGENHAVFSGAVGPTPDTGEQGDYRFELVSNDTRLMPAESSESEVLAALRLAGTFTVANRQLDISEFGIRTPGGELFSRGSVRFGDGSPEVILAFSIPSMRVSEAKHIWPAIFASGARRWVLAHVFGGDIKDSTINIAFAEGAIWPRSSTYFLPNGEQVQAKFNIENARFDVIGDLPPVRNANAVVKVAGADTEITLSSGTAFLGDEKSVAVKNGTMSIPVRSDQPVVANLDVTVDGEADAIADIANREPIKAFEKAPVSPSDLSGTASAVIKAQFPLRRTDTQVAKKWSANVAFQNLSIARDFGGQKLTEADGTLAVADGKAIFDAKGKLNGLPANVSLTEPIGADGERSITADLVLDDAARASIAPGLSDIVKGPVTLSLTGTDGSTRKFEATLDDAVLSLPWAGWSKGAGVAGKASFNLESGNGTTKISNLVVSGATFSIAGDVTLSGNALKKAQFTKVALNKGDNAGVTITRDGEGYKVSVQGQSLDLRALLKRVSNSFDKAAQVTGGAPITLTAKLASATGFNGEQLSNVIASYYGAGSNIISFAANAKSSTGGNIALDNSAKDSGRAVTIQTDDGGAMLRFMDIYPRMFGGRVTINLTSSEKGVLSGEVDARNFVVTGEPRLKALAGSPLGPDGKPIEGAKSRIDTSSVRFERGNALIEKGKGFLRLRNGILRSEQFGLSYEGTLYNPQGRIEINGTFLPIYGINRIFGDLPIFGQILGNGRDNALLGITFKLAGDAKAPILSVNPISIIAPGIFRQIFQFR